MKLLFITGSLVHGGAERHSITLYNRLAERGHECHAVYVKNDPSQLERLRPRNDGRVRCLHARRYLDLRSLGELAALMRALAPGVLIAANPYALMYAALARRLAAFAAPLMVTFHTTRPGSTKEWLQMLYYRPFFWRAECGVFVCETQRRYWLRRGLWSRRSETIYNGVDLEHWRPAAPAERRRLRAVLGFAEHDLVTGMCAVLRPEKNHLQLVEAIAALRRRGLPAKALLIGDGVMRRAIEARAHALGVSDAVLISGFQQDVRPMVAVCDAVALCSTAVETFSLAALEAMALGKPVVHSRTGGAAEMVRPGRNGFLFPVGDTRALADKLALLAERETRERMGARAREVVESEFAESTMVERYEQLLLQLESSRSRREDLRKPARAH